MIHLKAHVLFSLYVFREVEHISVTFRVHPLRSVLKTGAFNLSSSVSVTNAKLLNAFVFCDIPITSKIIFSLYM